MPIASPTAPSATVATTAPYMIVASRFCPASRYMPAKLAMNQRKRTISAPPRIDATTSALWWSLRKLTIVFEEAL